MKITVFGAGAFGTALGNILKTNNHQVDFYDPIKYPNQGLTSIIENSEINVLAVPSSAASKLLLFLPQDRPLICASKGFLSIASFLPFKQNFSILSGGAFAADLAKQKNSTLTSTSQIIDQLFSAPYIKYDHTDDLLGVTLCGSFKNVYAIGAGYWDLKYGTLDFDDFINSSLDEIRRILIANNCDPKTANLSCGVNDLVITCASPASRNYDFGVKLKTNSDFGIKVLAGDIKIETTEGLSTISQLDKTPSFIKPTNTPILDRIVALSLNKTTSEK